MTAAWIVLSSGNGSGNHGDAMMWESAVLALRRAVGPVHVITDGPGGWQPPLPDVTVLPYLYLQFRGAHWAPRGVRRLVHLSQRPWRLGLAERRARKFVLGSGRLSRPTAQWRAALADCSGVLVSGAGAITDDYAEHGVISWAAIARYARQLGKPVAFVGQGIGPVTRPRLRTIAKHMLNDADLVTVRESGSAVVCKELGVDTPVVVTPDWVLDRSVNDAERASADRIYNSFGDRRPTIGVAIHRRTNRVTRAAATLDREITGLARLLVAEGVRVVLIPNAVGAGANDDVRYLLQVADRIDRPDGVAVVEEQTSPGSSRALLGMMDAVISTRYHALLFALAEGVPGVGLSMDSYYDQKLRGALRWFGLEEFFVRLAPGCAADVMTLATQALSQRVEPSLISALSARVTAPLSDWLTDVAGDR